MTVEGEARGLFTQIPGTSSYSGWVCRYDPNVAPPVSDPNAPASPHDPIVVDHTVVCTSHYLADIDVPAPIIDESTLQTTDGWTCEAFEKDDCDNSQVIECVNYLPTENEEGYSTGLWRWSPKDG